MNEHDSVHDKTSYLVHGRLIKIDARYAGLPYEVACAAQVAAERAHTKMLQADSDRLARANRERDIDRVVDWFTRLLS